MNIRDIISGHESDTVEFKEGFDKRTIESVVAFANTKGGIIVIGVTDDGEVKGVEVGKQTLNKWVNQISQRTDPKLSPHVHVENVDGKDVVVIEIPEFSIKPVSTGGRCFKRVGSSNRQMTSSEITEMHLSSTGMSWDALPARGAEERDINLEKVEKYIEIANRIGRKNIKEGPLKVIEKLELVKDGKPSWASILLFGENPQKFLSQATIHCGRFKEEATIIDDRLIEGTIVEQIDEAMDFIKKNINVRFEITGKPQREEIWDYPLDALREAVINAVCHRDYADNSDIQIKIYDDRFYIWNPGGLPYGITVDDLYKPGHPSKPRNKLIAQIFYDMGIIEKYGSGAQRMITACKEAGLPEPKFEECFGGFSVTFQIYTEEYLRGMGLNERQIKAVMYVKETGEINLSSFKSLVTGVSEKTLYRDLQDLVSKGVLKQIGEKKWRKYKLQ